MGTQGTCANWARHCRAPKLVLGSGAIGVRVDRVLALPSLVVNELSELTVFGFGGEESTWVPSAKETLMEKYQDCPCQGSDLKKEMELSRGNEAPLIIGAPACMPSLQILHLTQPFMAMDRNPKAKNLDIPPTRAKCALRHCSLPCT